MAEYEANLIRGSLLRAGGSVSLTLIELGIPRKTLYDKIARLGIDLDAIRSVKETH